MVKSVRVGLSAKEEAIYLRTLPAIRERCYKVFDLAKEDKLQYFTYHPEKEDEVAEYCVRYMKGRYDNFDEVPFISYLSHVFEINNAVDTPTWTMATPRHLTPSYPYPSILLAFHRQNETSETPLDLFIVSVLLDAGAGPQWKYHEKASGLTFSRSEGLGVASVRMFEDGVFSSDREDPFRVDAEKLKSLTPATLSDHMQVTDSNPLVGLEGRAGLLRKLGVALEERWDLFVGGRPGGLIDYLIPLTTSTSKTPTLPLPALWEALMDGLGPIWPKRHSLGGIELGDVWPCDALKESLKGAHLIPFHKLTQWLTYSLLEIFTGVLGWEVVGGEDMTGLPEYRNGGPLPTHPASGLPFVNPGHAMVVEWRALTVVLLDRIADLIRKKTNPNLTLAQILEAATWNCGREIAKEKREGGGPPVEIDSDGTVF
ncbi:hypothetical protein BDQ17DRAFT_1392269 [Cyathus striatus]|nr:hypothetical protein BDQ17DRAFT_1392269 [Cyathus striatus]